MEENTNKLENLLRRCSLEKLAAIEAISSHDRNVLDTTTISGTLDQTGKDLGATISSLTRTKIDGKPLLVASGKTDKGILWRFNSEIAEKSVIHALVSEILKESKDYIEMEK